MRKHGYLYAIAALLIGASAMVAYAQHLKRDYPFLFSLVLRTHPLQDRPSAVVG